MNKNSSSTLKNIITNTIIVLAILGLTACSSPEEKAIKFYKNGMNLFEKGDYVKARVEFRNALQLNRKMTKAIWGQLHIAEKLNKPRQQYKLLNSILANEPKNIEAIVKIGRFLILAGKIDKALEKSNLALTINKDDLSALSLRATIMLKQGNLNEAKKIANQILLKDPQYLDALMVLATERLKSGDSEKSLEYIERALKKDNKNIAFNLIKIKAFESLKKHDQIEQVIKKLINDYPAIKTFNTVLAQFYLKQNRKEDAESVYRAIVEQVPDDLKAKLDLVRFISGVKGREQGLAQLKIFVQEDPQNNELKFTLVQLHLVRNEGVQAKEILKNIITSNQSSEIVIKAKGMMAAILFAQGDKKTAESLVNEILLVDKQDENALILKANISIADQNYDDATATLRAVLRDTPNSSRALFSLAKTYDLSGSADLADKEYLKAFKASKYNSKYGLSYVQFLLKRKQIKRAEKIIQNVLSVSRNNTAALELLAKIRLAQRDWRGAQQVADAFKSMGVKGNAHVQITNAILVAQKKYNESISLLKTSYQSEPHNMTTIVSLVKTYMLSGKKREAARFLDKVIKASPKNINARVLRGNIYRAQGNTKQAINAYNKVIEDAPAIAGSYNNLALIYRQQKNHTKAREVLLKGITNVPKSFSLNLSLAQIYEETNQQDSAIKVYETLFKINPNADVVANNLASLLMENRTDDASMTKAYNLSKRFKESKVPQLQDTFGWANYKLGKYSEAGRLIKSAISRLPNIPDFHYHLGMNYLAKKQNAMAREALEKALQVAKDKPFTNANKVKAALEKI